MLVDQRRSTHFSIFFVAPVHDRAPNRLRHVRLDHRRHPPRRGGWLHRHNRKVLVMAYLTNAPSQRTAQSSTVWLAHTRTATPFEDHGTVMHHLIRYLSTNPPETNESTRSFRAPHHSRCPSIALVSRTPHSVCPVYPRIVAFDHPLSFFALLADYAPCCGSTWRPALAFSCIAPVHALEPLFCGRFATCGLPPPPPRSHGRLRMDLRVLGAPSSHSRSAKLPHRR